MPGGGREAGARDGAVIRPRRGDAGTARSWEGRRPGQRAGRPGGVPAGDPLAGPGQWGALSFEGLSSLLLPYKLGSGGGSVEGLRKAGVGYQNQNQTKQPGLCTR